MSVEAVHFVVTEVVDAAEALKPVGTLGAVVSTVQVQVAGVASATPLDVAYTEKVWLALVRPEYVIGLVQVVVAAASSLQVKVEPLMVEVKENDAEADEVGEVGLVVMVVSGAG